MLRAKRQPWLGAEKTTVVNCGRNRPAGSDPQTRRVFDFLFAKRKRLAIVDGVSDEVFVAKDGVDHSSRPRSRKMIRDVFEVEPPNDLFLRLLFFDILLEYPLDHCNFFREAEMQDDTVALQVLLLAAFEISL